MTGEKSNLADRKSTWAVPLEGRLWLLTCAGLLVIGLFKGINLLLLLACLMTAGWSLNALLAGRWLNRLEGRRWVGQPVFAQTPFTVQLLIANAQPKPVLGVRIKDGGPENAQSWYLPRVNGRQTLSLQWQTSLPQRGRYTWGTLQASSGYPFGLMRRTRSLVPGETIIVLPRLGRLHRGRLRQFLKPAGFASATTRDSARRHPTAQAEFHGLRSFRSGDSPRWIHWRTSARCGELMVREFEDLPNDNLVLLVDPELPRDPSAKDGDLLEALLSMAATVCWEWCRQKGDRLTLIMAGPEPVVLEGPTNAEHAQRLLECLAVQTGQPPEAPVDLREHLAGRALPPGPVLLLSARPSRLNDQVAECLDRPVAALDMTALSEIDFYEGPPLPTARG